MGLKVSDFKVGQKVALIDNRGMAAPFGATAIVVKGPVDGFLSTSIKVKWEGDVNNQTDGYYGISHFKVLPQGGQLTFSFYK